MPPGPGRHHAIEHVDAAAHRFDKVVGRADTHQVARLAVRQVRHHGLDHLEHHGLRLADRQAADGVAVKVHVGQGAGALDPQRRVGAALHDGEGGPARHVAEGLRGTARPSAATGAWRARPPRASTAAGRIRRAASGCRTRAGPGSPWRAPASGRGGCRRYATGTSRPVSSRRRSLASDMTWKPPESVRIGCGQFMKRCRPPSSATRSAPGRIIR